MARQWPLGSIQLPKDQEPEVCIVRANLGSCGMERVRAIEPPLSAWEEGWTQHESQASCLSKTRRLPSVTAVGRESPVTSSAYRRIGHVAGT